MVIGEIRKNKYSQNQVWLACDDCGKERWVRLRWGEPIYRLCVSCAHKGLMCSHETALKISAANKGKRYYTKRGGRLKDGNGYIRVRVSPNSDFYSMADKAGYSLEHRIVCAQYLGRCLQRWEIIHHKDGIRDNNDLDNLELTTQGSHMETRNSNRGAYNKGFQDGLRVKNDELLKEIRLMRWQLKEIIGEHKLLEQI